MEQGPKAKKSEEKLDLNEKGFPQWEARKPLILGREHFEFQMEFAEEIHHQTGKPLLDIIGSRTSLLRLNAFEFDEDGRMHGLKPGITEENVVDKAYAEYLSEADEEPVQYHKEGGSRYGCFYYDEADDETKDAIRIHFFNAEFDKVGPLDQSKIGLRKKEMTDILGDIKTRHPNAQEIHGMSWLYNLPSYRRLFPQSYLNNLMIEDDPFQWARGTTIWGQFMDNQYRLKQDLAQELLTRLKALPADRPLSDLFREDSPIMAPLTTYGPIKDFDDMYGAV
jgi:hypothetical protein